MRHDNIRIVTYIYTDFAYTDSVQKDGFSKGASVYQRALDTERERWTWYPFSRIREPDKTEKHRSWHAINAWGKRDGEKRARAIERGREKERERDSRLDCKSLGTSRDVRDRTQRALARTIYWVVIFSHFSPPQLDSFSRAQSAYFYFQIVIFFFRGRNFFYFTVSTRLCGPRLSSSPRP